MTSEGAPLLADCTECFRVFTWDREADDPADHPHADATGHELTYQSLADALDPREGVITDGGGKA